MYLPPSLHCHNVLAEPGWISSLHIALRPPVIILIITIYIYQNKDIYLVLIRINKKG